MRQSELFTKTLKEAPKDEESVNARLLIRAGFVDKLMAGVYTFLPLGLRVLKKIENIIRNEMENLGGQEILMPTLQPKANWQATGRWDSLDSLFKFASFYSKIEYAMGPTHEEIVSPLLKKYIFSYKDLPLSVFQMQNKFRDEKRVKSGLLRGREFFMKDLYSFHKEEGDLDKYYEKVKKSYFNIFKKLNLDKLTYLTFASGGSFSKYSHEFQIVSGAGEDIIFTCEKCRVAVNKEIIGEQKDCPVCGNKDLKEEKAIEAGNIFKLKTKYSKPFNLTFKDRDGSEKDVIMGCYGLGQTRLMGAVVEIFHDSRGIIWPKNIAPFDVHLLELNSSNPLVNKKIKKTAEEIYGTLQNKGKEVLYDERDNASIGEKFADCDLIGIPLRMVVSEKTLKTQSVEIKKRNSVQSELVKIKEIKNKFINE